MRERERALQFGEGFGAGAGAADAFDSTLLIRKHVFSNNLFFLLSFVLFQDDRVSYLDRFVTLLRKAI